MKMEIKTVGIAGSGTMGAGIAIVAARVAKLRQESAAAKKAT